MCYCLDARSVEMLRRLCAEVAAIRIDKAVPPAAVSIKSLDTVFFATNPSQVLYCLEVTYALLMPAYNPTGEEVWDFQVE